MAQARVQFHQAVLDHLLYSPAGPVAQETRRVANLQLLPIARDALSRPWPGPPGPFPPPGPPFLRTGELRDSLVVTESIGPFGAEWNISPTAIHRGWNYGEVLLKRGYKFFPDGTF